MNRPFQPPLRAPSAQVVPSATFMSPESRLGRQQEAITPSPDAKRQKTECVPQNGRVRFTHTGSTQTQLHLQPLPAAVPRSTPPYTPDHKLVPTATVRQQWPGTATLAPRPTPSYSPMPRIGKSPLSSGAQTAAPPKKPTPIVQPRSPTTAAKRQPLMATRPGKGDAGLKLLTVSIGALEKVQSSHSVGDLYVLFAKLRTAVPLPQREGDTVTFTLADSTGTMQATCTFAEHHDKTWPINTTLKINGRLRPDHFIVDNARAANQIELATQAIATRIGDACLFKL